MPICKTPGETTVGRIEDRKKPTFALKEALISTDLSNSNFGVEPRGSTKAVFYKERSRRTLSLLSCIRFSSRISGG